MEQEQADDPVGLARKYVAGLNIKRGDAIQMVKSLLALLDIRDSEEITLPLGPVHDPRVLPPCLVTVEKTSTGAVFIGHDANRTYSKEEALSLVEKILKVAQ